MDGFALLYFIEHDGDGYDGGVERGEHEGLISKQQQC